MQFTKLHGTGNDFIVIDARELDQDWPSLAQRMCDRHLGIGADGLLLALASETAPLRMRLFNADGSEAEMSGNGLRCFTKFAVDRGLIQPEDGIVTIETLAGVLSAEVSLAGEAVESVRVAMGQPRFAAQDIPVAIEAEPPIVNMPLEAAGQELSLTCVSMGNPHAVHFTDDDVAAFPIETVGPIVERHERFPNRVNFEVARVLSRDRMSMRVWERGVGITLSCGSGASAVMVAARLAGAVDDRAEVQLPGGSLTLEWDGEGEVYLTGPAAEVFEGGWPD